MQNRSKIFAFSISDKMSAKPKAWIARPGSVAQYSSGCTFTGDEFDNYASDYDIFGKYRGRDKGYYC